MANYRTLCIWPLAATFAAVCLTGTAPAQDTAATPAKLDPPVKPEVSGKFLGDGKPAAIKYILIEEHEEFDDKPAMSLVFSEKNPATVEKPSFEASFGKLGSALTLSVFYDGSIFGCEVAHSAHKKSGFSSIGQIKMLDFKVAGGNVTGHVSTEGTQDAFGQKWEVDMKFSAPLPEKLRAASLAPPKPAAKEKATESRETTPAEPAEAAATGPAISAKSLPLPKDASNVQYKALVHQIQYTSGQTVAAVVTELSDALKKQGWKDGTGSLNGTKNAILKREQGAAKLTIMIHPAPAGSVGSTIKIFSEGLDWDDVGRELAAPADNPADGADAAEKEAQKAVKDALKDMPGF